VSVNSVDTIAAIATAAGAAAIAVVRMSGPQAIAITEGIVGGSVRPRHAGLRTLRTPAGETIDKALVLSFPGPYSYTGEDLVEFHIHGGSVVSDWLLETLFAAGARHAEPGEFTLRAFLNDKLDLTQAEAVADLISSHSRAGASAARRSLMGQFSARIDDVQSMLTRVRAQLEAHLDFPDEDIEPEELAVLDGGLDTAVTSIDRISAQAQHGVRLRDGLSIAIAGPPNAGKSSLLNRLAGYDAAIVTDVPGTTRDPLREQIIVEGLPLQIVDTAGLRETDDPIEREGARRARIEATKADQILWLFDARAGEAAAREAAEQQFGDTSAVIVVLNKIDLLSEACTVANASEFIEERNRDSGAVRISALTGAGLESLIGCLKRSAGWRDGADGAFTARRRHLDALARTREKAVVARRVLASQPELAAEELRLAQAALSEITGALTSDDLLGEIFSSFCIGK
jgi:tRNA modification GTPase